MIGVFTNKRQLLTLIISVVASMFVVTLLVQAVTYVDTDSVGVATATPGGALGVKGVGIFDGFVSADYYTSTSTNNSWFLANFGLGTTTPGVRLGVLDDVDIAGLLTVESHIETSYLLATSTTASTFGGAITVSGTATSSVTGGLTVDTDTLNVDSSSNRVGIATSSFPSIGDQIVNVSIGVGTASTTVYIAGAGSVGSGIILKDSDGNGCTILMVNDGLLEATDVVCPAP